MEQKIFLQSFNSKKSVNTSEGLHTNLFGKRKLLPTNDYGYVVNQYEQYSEERNHCNTIRLTCQVNPICSNVLFNSITEIVKNEGSNDVHFLNYKQGNIENDLQNVWKTRKGADFWASSICDGFEKTDNFFLNPIRDTQLTNDRCGFIYHCGIDILNNHLIRTNTFKTVCKDKDLHEYFNTISDYMRQVDGSEVSDVLCFPYQTQTRTIKYHLYQYDDILSYTDTKAQRLVQKYNGWVGFINKSKIKSYDTSFNDSLQIERPIMYKNGGDFIDMYPTRELYSFVPRYNSYRHRIEKNWACAITYPSSSTTEGFDNIYEKNAGVNAPKAIYFDENTTADNGTKQLVIYSITKHGLKNGDFVNIYKTYISANTTTKVTEKVLNSVEVTNIVDDFIFTVASDGMQISNAFVYLSDTDLKSRNINVNGKTYTKSSNGKYYTNKDNRGNKYYIVNSRYINLDDTSQSISYKKIVNDIECDYYVRVFSRLPNFKWASDDTSSEHAIYKNDGKILKEYQDYNYEFENHVSRLAFAKNIYSDDLGEIVFTDDINIDNLHDNLGRPISSLYITFFKNNRGYKEWYGYDYNNSAWETSHINNENVEFSHCFGRLMCGIECSEESRFDENLPNIHSIKNSNFIALDVDSINTSKRPYSNELEADKTEVIYWNDKNFYGDICCYDNYNALEMTLQPILYRFNTAQRECENTKSKDYFSKYGYDEITKDDYDTNDNYTVSTYLGSDKCNKKHEGYYYQPSYEIPIKTFDVLQSVMPDMLTIRKMSSNKITTLTYHYLSVGDKAMLYDSKNDKYYILVTTRGANDDYRTFSFNVYDENGNESNLNGVEKDYAKLFKLDNLEIPSYAKLLKDGTCRYIWRNIVNNGMGTDDSIETYPFTNGAFYINKRIDIYVRRQDPYGTYGLRSNDDIPGKEMGSMSENNYVTDEEITC